MFVNSDIACSVWKTDDGEAERIFVEVFVGMIEWGRKSDLEPTENESFVYCFGEYPGARWEHLAIQSLWFWYWSREWGGDGSPRFT